MPSILFVCTANQCRSPMAETLFRKYLADRGELDGWRIGSAGTWAAQGVPATGHVQQVMQERGLDVAGHRARIVDDALVGESDLVLTMERGHKEALQIEFPQSAARIFLLSEMVGKVFDIADPIGGPHEEYEATASELEALIERGAPRIMQLASQAA